MKAQGLPLNFIVLAAMAILILVLVVAFVLMGRQSLQSSMTPSAIKTTCDGYCQNINNYAADKDSPGAGNTITGAPSSFCSKTFATSTSTNSTCTSTANSCIANFGDGSSCKINCVKSGNAWSVKCA